MPGGWGQPWRGKEEKTDCRGLEWPCFCTHPPTHTHTRARTHAHERDKIKRIKTKGPDVQKLRKKVGGGREMVVLRKSAVVLAIN